MTRIIINTDHMKLRLLILTVSWICILTKTYSIEKDTLVYLPELAIVDTLIYPILDRAIDYEMKFFRRNNTFVIILIKEKGKINLGIGYLNKEDAKHYNSDNCGYLYYRENLFFVRVYNNIRINKFFLKSKSNKSFYFNEQNELIHDNTEETSWSYYYMKKKYVFDYLFDVRLENGGYGIKF